MREKTREESENCAAEMPRDVGLVGMTPTRSGPQVPLFVIKMRNREQYWTCSSEHGSGWNNQPKQSFSPSELATQVGLLAREFWTDISIIQLSVS